MTQPKTIQLGQAVVTVINIGDFQADLGEWLNAPQSEWPAQYAGLAGHPIRLPVQSVHVKLGNVSLLVDAAFYDLEAAPEMVPPGYQPPPDLISQLASIGVQPESVTHVVVTHAHFDHYNGLIQKRDGQVQLTFPNALCYLGRADWERTELQEALQNPDSMQSQTFGLLHQQGLLTFVEGDLDLGPGVQIITAPGETPGHQVVRVQSEGQTLYITTRLNLSS
jgi:glyoxylase-like metal-dependent hydrolase (beta-lactamase superfamily II)